MKNRVKIFAQAKICLFLLVALCSFSLPLASAQKDRPGDIPEGYTLIDGDILMPTAFVNALRQQKRDTLAATFRFNLWPNGVVPFEFDANCAPGSTTCVMPPSQTAMLNAMAILENLANVDFRQCPNNDCDGNYVHIQNSTVDTSQVGMMGGQQFMTINRWGAQFVLVHELLHSLGFYHEHTRPDRNNFVQINCNNVQGGCFGNNFMFNFVIPGDAAQYGFYDFDSVMHYSQCGFSINNNCPAVSPAFPDGGITIRVLPPYDTQWQNAIGQRDHLSDLDRATVSFLYPFADWRFLDCNYNGSNGSSNGTFRRPYTTLAAALANTPAGGTLWVLSTCNFQVAAPLQQRITIRAAPGVIATLGD